ncbi:MAG: MTH1187 family thiamine-binding protein [Lentisphaeraceae bacterium]|nr:MTH1187 family thiamine-binding protein [Lentisphaeraceae bacterium]
MKVIADICLIPIGVGVSLSPYVKIAYETLKKSGLKCTLGPYGTVVEGDYDDVVKAMKAAMEAVHEKGAPKITMTIKMGSRIDKDQSASDKVDSVLKL